MNDLATPDVQDKAQGLLCPACRVNLVMSERQSIEIDYCPNCRGIWLDRGELDKIIERSVAAEPASPVQPAQPPQPPAGYAPGYAPPQPSPWAGGQGWDRGYDPRYGKKRKKSFLEELFD